MFKANTSVPTRWGNLLRGALACLLAFLLLNPAAVAATPVSNELDKLPPGTGVQVEMNDGQILRGKLVSHSESTFDFVESRSSEAMTIDNRVVVSVRQTREHRKIHPVVKGILVGSFVALTGIAIAATCK